MLNLPHQYVFAILVVIVFCGLLCVRSVRQWFKRRFKELDLLEEYFPLLFTRWQAAIWGGSVLAVAFGWHFITSDWPYPVKLSACVMALFFAGYYVWRADHIRLQRRVDVMEPRLQEWAIPQGSVNAGHRARAFYLDVVNKSEGITVEGVSAQLNIMSPEVQNLDWLPIPLHLKHDNAIRETDYARSFNLNPGELRSVDFVSAIEGDNRFSITHVVPRVNNQVPFGTAGHRLQVIIAAKDMRKILKVLQFVNSRQNLYNSSSPAYSRQPEGTVVSSYWAVLIPRKQRNSSS